MKPIYCIILLLGIAAAPQISKQRIAVRELVARAGKGDSKALYDLAMLHDTGYDSIPVDSARSTALYRMSAEAGYPPAQSYLGFRYFNGEAIRENVDSALFWIARAAGSGDVRAANNLGYLLANSEKVARNYPQAIYWLNKASEAGLPAALSQLADLYRQGLGCDPDTARAESLYVKAIHGGLHDAELKLLAMKGKSWEALPEDSLLTLGKYHYTHGAPIIGVTLLMDILKKSGDDSFLKGNQIIIKPSDLTEEDKVRAKAFALLGDAFSRGIGVEYNHESSIRFFLQGALREEPSAQFVIAELLDIFPDALDSLIPPSDTTSTLSETPDSIASQLTNAAYWYERAASQGITDAATATRRLLE